MLDVEANRGRANTLCSDLAETGDLRSQKRYGILRMNSIPY